MESYHTKDLALAIFEHVLGEGEFRDFADVGIVVQCYLRDSGRDLLRLRDWSRRRGTPVWVRLVKGAYWDYETVHAAQHGRPSPVYAKKWQTDANFERQTRFLLANHDQLRPAMPATTCVRSPMPRPLLGNSTFPATLRVSNALRDGRSGERGDRRSRLSFADLHALRRVDSRHGIPCATAAGGTRRTIRSCARRSRNTFPRRPC